MSYRAPGAGIPDDVPIQGSFRRFYVRDLVDQSHPCNGMLPGGDRVSAQVVARKAPDPGVVCLLHLQVGNERIHFMAHPDTEVLLPNGHCHVRDLESGMALYGGAVVVDCRPLLVFSSFYRLYSPGDAFVKAGHVYIRTARP